MTMTMSGVPAVRRAEPDGASRFTPLLRRLRARLLVTAASVRRDLEPGEDALSGAWAAWAGDKPVGWAEVRPVLGGAPHTAWVWAGVLPEYRGQGIGSLLIGVVRDHVTQMGVERLRSGFYADEPSALRLAEALAFIQGRTQAVSELDLSAITVGSLNGVRPQLSRHGFELRPLSALREQELFDLYAAVDRDVPGDEGWRPDLAEWRRAVRNDPTTDLDLGHAATLGGRAVALCWLQVDREGRRGFNHLTGTRPEHRRRGLARWLKLETAAAARKAGIRTLVTINDSRNVGMLALNERLGYRPWPLWIEVTRTLQPPSPARHRTTSVPSPSLGSASDASLPRDR